ncbi:hypothetical protein SynMVIR181_01206 [Synechococcus sp. MVIR-18-1]|nr:hypothetical protein SynMVIR181_01206 [Synechococcus sp. MVIR-18-1]
MQWGRLQQLRLSIKLITLMVLALLHELLMPLCGQALLFYILYNVAEFSQ